MNTLSRNCPVAYVVGAAGFLGSALVEKLLEKNIQVVGVDDLSTGNSDNISSSLEKNNFHFIEQSADEELSIVLTRLDYAFFILPENLEERRYFRCLENFLRICEKAAKLQEHFPKIVFVSSIDLYDEGNHQFQTLREAERKLAHYSTEKKANIRIVRLDTIYGPRMHFRGIEPLLKLILAAVNDTVQKETTPLDFSTRALFVDDAVNLLIKAVMHGATAQKLYDGAVSPPVKLSEVKQVLLDPLWHESRGFNPTELPPWPTPNLGKTEKELLWKPLTSLVNALKQTVVYFKENQHNLPRDREEDGGVGGNYQDFSRTELQPEKQGEDSGITKGVEVTTTVAATESKEGLKKRNKITSFKLRIPVSFYLLTLRKITRMIVKLTFIAVIIYALIYPAAVLSVGGIKVNQYFNQAYQAMTEGDMAKVSLEVEKINKEVRHIDSVAGPEIKFLQVSVLGKFIGEEGKIVDLFIETSQSLQLSTAGLDKLQLGFKQVSGEKEGDGRKSLAEAFYKLEEAETSLDQNLLLLANLKKSTLLPYSYLQLDGLENKLAKLKKLTSEEKNLALTLSQILGKEGNQSLLVLLSDNRTLRPGGGVPTVYAEVFFKQGKLDNVAVGSVADLDKKLNENLLPPVEVTQDTSEKKWTLKNSNFEPDFAVNARVAEWFYRKEKGVNVLGVMNLDFSALTELINILGPITPINSEGGVEGKGFLNKLEQQEEPDKFLGEVFKETLNRLFYLSPSKIIPLTNSLVTLGREKHWLLYLNDPQSQFLLSNISSVFPKQGKEVEGKKENFLSVLETNLNPTSGTLQKDMRLQTKLNPGGGVSHKLTISYTAPVKPASFRVRLYFSAGSKLTGAKWGGEDIFKKVSSFTDYGRAGYTVTLDLKSGEKKELSLEYEDVKLLNFKDGKLGYTLNVYKQLNAGDGKFDFTIDYPSTVKAISQVDDLSSGRRVSFSADLSVDRSFVVPLEKIN